MPTKEPEDFEQALLRRILKQKGYGDTTRWMHQQERSIRTRRMY